MKIDRLMIQKNIKENKNESVIDISDDVKDNRILKDNEKRDWVKV